MHLVLFLLRCWTRNSSYAGNGLYVYKSVPTMTLSSLPTSTLATGSGVVISKFTVATSGTGTVGWKKLDFTVSKIAGAAKLAISSPILWDMDNNQQVAGTGVVTTLAATDAAGSITFIPTTEEQISGSRTYELRVTVTDATGLETADFINTSIAAPSVSKTASDSAFATGTLATTWAYYDPSNGGTVNTGDVRQTAVDQFTAVTAESGGAVGAVTSTVTSKGFGVASSDTIIVTYGGGADPVITGTLVTAGYACTSDKNNAGITADGVFTVTCTKAATGSIAATITLTTKANWGAADDAVTSTITKTAGAYAINTVVGASDSDVGLALTTNVTAAASLVWSDVSAQSHSVFTTDWTTDFLVKNLPTSTQNLVK
jgi:hypothetical protein